jgi:predicted Zn finger-like uncharacterized protein
VPFVVFALFVVVLADTPMLIVCPNCASSYGVDMASLRPARGRPRTLRCSRCRFAWQAELSSAEKLMVVADAVLPVRRAMLAVAQVAAEAARSTLPHLRRRATTILAEELAAASPDARPDGASIFAARPAAPGFAQRVHAASSEAVPALRQASWPPSWRLSWAFWKLSPQLSWLSCWRAFWPPSLSGLHYIVVALALIDAAVMTWRADVVSIMPQTAKFYAALGFPVNLRGVQFDHLTAAAERHDGEAVLVVKGEIGNSTGQPEAVPHLRFAILDAQQQEIYSWTAVPSRGRRLPAGQTLAFQSELTLPPPDTRAVAVRFIDPDNAL